MVRDVDPTISLLTTRGALRRTGLALRVCAGFGFAHAGFVVGVGVLIAAILEVGVPPEWVLTLLFFGAILTASAMAVALGLGLRSLSSASIHLFGFASEKSESDGAVPSMPRTAYRDGRIASRLCFVFVGIGLVAIALPLLFPSDGAGAIAVSFLWFSAFLILVMVGVFGGVFVEKFLRLVGIYDDPFHLLRWYAALTAFFSNWLLLAGAFFAGGVLGAVFIALPFGLCPLIGIAAFRRIYRVGSQLVRIVPTLPATGGEREIYPKGTLENP